MSILFFVKGAFRVCTDSGRMTRFCVSKIFGPVRAAFVPFVDDPVVVTQRHPYFSCLSPPKSTAEL